TRTGFFRTRSGALRTCVRGRSRAARELRQHPTRVRSYLPRVVSALLHAKDRKPERREVAPDARERADRAAEVARGIVPRDVESERDHQEARSKLLHRTERLLQCDGIRVVVRALGERNVEVVAAPLARAAFVLEAGEIRVGAVRVAMDRDERDV